MTGKLVVIGDLHLNDNHLWSPEVCDHAITELIAVPCNTPENTLVLLGDLTENPLNSGAVFEKLMILFKGLKYKKIYIVVGNHDIRQRAGIEVTPYDFVTSDPRVKICSTPGEVVMIEGFSCLMLPHFLPSEDKPSVNRYYSSLSGEYDFIFGHIADETAAMVPEALRANLSKLKGIRCLGHVHTRTSSSYVGSVFAGTIKEIENNRAIWVFDSNKNKTEIPLPIFLDYQNVNYPDALPRTKALTTVYTFYGADEGTIREKYGKVYIRRVIRNLDSNLKTDLSKASSIASLKDAKDTSKLIDTWTTTLKEKPADRLLGSLKHYAH